MATASFTPTANEDALTIWLYIAQHSEERANNFFDKLNETSQLLADNPAMGRARPELRDDVRSFPLSGYAIYYRPISDGVEVVRLLHGSRDIIPELFS